MPLGPRAVAPLRGYGGLGAKAGGVTKGHVCASREVGSAIREVGSASREVGSGSREVGDAIREVGDAIREVGDTSREVGRVCGLVGAGDGRMALSRPASVPIPGG